MSTTVVPLSVCRSPCRICSGVNLLFRIPASSRPRESGLDYLRCQNGAPPDSDPGDQAVLVVQAERLNAELCSLGDMNTR